MNRNNYFNEQINKSYNHTLNKVIDFSGNHTVGFFSLIKILLKQNDKFVKWVDPEKWKQLHDEGKAKSTKNYSCR